ncbi:MAG: DUF3298 and DUF4163 domain-containing protein [Clostridia bacterium]|nr:DUF3298 and DUF4163 domain-containing protein [Clostridia bacterium]
MKNEIKENIIENKLKYDNTIIMTYKITYPQIISSKYKLGKDIFNRYNEKIAQDLKTYTEGELYLQAKEVYEYNKKHGYPVMVFEVILETKITYNEDKILSLYQDQYTFTGGAHGSTVRTSQNWNLATARQIQLYSLYSNPYFLLDILRKINLQIANEKENYFDNYCELVLETFNPNQYYITDKGINIFFGQYDIAPYSSGIPVFLV